MGFQYNKILLLCLLFVIGMFYILFTIEVALVKTRVATLEKELAIIRPFLDQVLSSDPFVFLLKFVTLHWRKNLK